MSEIQMLLIGAGIGLISTIAVQWFIHFLAKRRDVDNQKNKQVRWVEEIRMEKKREIKELEAKKTKYEMKLIEYATGKIILMNQRRDMIRGFNKEQTKNRALTLQMMLSDMDTDELFEIADEKKPLPEILGKP